MQHSISTRFSYSTLEWNDLNKSDYTQIFEYIYNLGVTIDHNLSMDNISIRVADSTKNLDSSYTPDEFSKFFSIHSAFDRIGVYMSTRNAHFICYISMSRKDSLLYDDNEGYISLDSGLHTSAELEDILEEIKSFLENLYHGKSLASSNKVKNAGANLDNTNSKCPSDTERSPNKWSVRWGAVAAIGAVLAPLLALAIHFGWL